jgi:aminoglycoside phosphotransferase (APT) family kinase protein
VTAWATMKPALAAWLTARTGQPGPWTLRRLPGGNSNETCLLTSASTERTTGPPAAQYVLRRPPRHALSASAHSVAREHRLLTALDGTGVPAPKPIALCQDPDVPLAPFLVMEHIADAVSITSTLPAPYADGPDAVNQVGYQTVGALASVHTLDWQNAGLDGFGRPGQFLERQVPRWYKQWRGIAQRPLPAMEAIAGWLERNRPPDRPPALLHGDFHLDNCLFSVREPRLLAIIDWEMATIGDPLLDLGLMLALWGSRPLERPAMPALQAISRIAGSASRDQLLAHYEDTTGQPAGHLTYYECLALFKLAAIIEAAYSQYLAGDLRTPYAAALEHDVPAMLDEACALAGVRPAP